MVHQVVERPGVPAELLYLLQLVLGALLQQGEDELVLALEVPVEGTAGVAGALDDLLDRGAADTVLGEEFGRGPQQLFAGEFPALLPGEPPGDGDRLLMRRRIQDCISMRWCI